MLGLLFLLVAVGQQVNCRTPDPLSCRVCGCPGTPSPPINSELQDSGGEVAQASQCSNNCTGPEDVGQALTCVTGACFKKKLQYVTTGGEIIIQRGCAEKNADYNLASEGREMNKCYSTTVLKILSIECQCDTHLCNSETKQTISRLLQLATPLLIFSISKA